jgi:hypothetical protein
MKLQSAFHGSQHPMAAAHNYQESTPGRLGVSSGPSEAATLAGARAALTEPERRAALDLDDDAVVLLSTEGHSR